MLFFSFRQNKKQLYLLQWFSDTLKKTSIFRILFITHKTFEFMSIFVRVYK